MDWARRTLLSSTASHSERRTTIDMKFLVLAADGTETNLPWIRQALELAAVQYDVFQAAPQPEVSTTDRLADMLINASTGQALYQGVILATSGLSYLSGDDDAWKSALTPSEWNTLRSFEARFKVRQVSWYTYPNEDYGFEPPSGTTSEPIPVSLTADGQSVFPYVDRAEPLVVSNSYAYLAVASDPSATPLLVDAAGNTLAVLNRYADGRENIALTFASSEYVAAAQVLSFGLVNWLGQGDVLSPGQIGTLVNGLNARREDPPLIGGRD
jgi:hypothetical protein